MGDSVAVGEAGDATIDGTIGEAGWGTGGVPAVAVALSSSLRAGDGEHGGARDVVGGVDASVVDEDAPCAPLAPPDHT